MEIATIDKNNLTLVILAIKEKVAPQIHNSSQKLVYDF